MPLMLAVLMPNGCQNNIGGTRPRVGVAATPNIRTQVKTNGTLLGDGNVDGYQKAVWPGRKSGQRYWRSTAVGGRHCAVSCRSGRNSSHRRHPDADCRRKTVNASCKGREGDRKTVVEGTSV